MAINDWPTYDLASLDGFVSELRVEIGLPLTLTNVRAKLDSYSSGRDAWKAASLCGLLDAWDISDGDVALDELFSRIGLGIAV